MDTHACAWILSSLPIGWYYSYFSVIRLTVGEFSEECHYHREVQCMVVDVCHIMFFFL
jgi:hypothetical protein